MKISFNSAIYTKKSILETIEAYKHLADFKIEYNDDIFVLNIDNPDDEIKDIIADEFANYALGLLKRN
jgi:protein-tyrosine phosphatase